jgi:cytochrome c5
MKTIHKILVVAAMIAGVLVTIVACTSTKKTFTDESTTAVTAVEEEFKLEKSGAQMWGETCNRCHLAPSPADYNDTDWETISLHMRVRANLNENEITKIEEFLKSAN